MYEIVDILPEDQKDKYGHYIYKAVCTECGFERFSKYANINRNISYKCRHPKASKKKTCINCGKQLNNHANVYCSNKCQQEYRYKNYISKWKNDEVSGVTGNAWIDVSTYIRRYLFEKFNGKCAICGWSKMNPYTGTIPLEVEHIDGDAMNNKEENLSLLCPNCHSLTKTYRGANKGKGKREIKWVSRSGTTNIKA